MMAQAMNETKSTDTDKLIAYFETEAQFDILKARKGYFRSWDHQLMQEAYPFTSSPRARPRTSGTSCSSARPCPAPNQPLEILDPTKGAEHLHRRLRRMPVPRGGASASAALKPRAAAASRPAAIAAWNSCSCSSRWSTASCSAATTC